jgi:hypothetical protein
MWNRSHELSRARTHAPGEKNLRTGFRDEVLEDISISVLEGISRFEAARR